jgi:hypothetical protein
LNLRVIEFFAFEPDEGKFSLPRLSSLSELGVLSPQIADAIRTGSVFLSQVREPAECIEQFELISRLKKRVTFALTVDIDQHLSNAFERTDCDGNFVDERGTATRTREPSREDEVVFFDWCLEDFRGEGLLFGPSQVKPAGHAEFIGTRADQIPAAALTQQQTESTEQKRFAGTCFTRPSAKPRLQFDPHILDQGKVLNGQFAEHTSMVREYTQSVKGPAMT